MVEHIARALVDAPQSVVVDPIRRQWRGSVSSWKSAPTDIGKVIGRQGIGSQGHAQSSPCGWRQTRPRLRPRNRRRLGLCGAGAYAREVVIDRRGRPNLDAQETAIYEQLHSPSPAF